LHNISGRCHCGNITVQVALPKSPETYRPRACDCEFCRKHAAAYVSDPDGTLFIHVIEPQLTIRYRQGSGSAEMLLCGRCGVLMGALYGDAGHRFGVVNARVLESTTLGSAETVSPKTLTADAKVERWRRLWFSGVQGA
jgi:hypothetical protein